MQVHVHYQGLESSPWMEQFIEKRVDKLERYVNSSATVLVNLKFENRTYVTSLAIHNLNHDYAFSASGENLYESFSVAIDKATRALAEQKRIIKDKINRRYTPLNQIA
jgi:ribosomal subunit interface protein